MWINIARLLYFFLLAYWQLQYDPKGISDSVFLKFDLLIPKTMSFIWFVIPLNDNVGPIIASLEKQESSVLPVQQLSSFSHQCHQLKFIWRDISVSI